jgi:hypothetical protein
MITHLYLAGEDQRLHIPYRPRSGSHTTNIGFIDLKAQPERIVEIHELTGYPDFEDLIRVLNQPGCSLRTLRVDTAKDDFERPGYSNSYFSFLTVSFEQPHPEDDKRYFSELYGSFTAYASGLILPDAVQVDFYIVPLEVKANKFSGWCLDIRLYGFGASVEEAMKNWSDGLRLVRELLLMVDKNSRTDSYSARRLSENR